MKDLIIVESPAKAKTIKSFLGSQFEVVASKGHIRDLPKFAFGITIEDGKFIPEYHIDSAHKELVSQIKKLAQNANTTYIATDEDREGEAIGYHIAQAIDKKKPLESYPRIVFHEITKSAIMHALQNPRTINMDMVNAQQARRLLDRIVGFRLSSLIAQKVSKGLSAGRVQSAALKIVVDREREIRAFIPQDYFTITAMFQGVLGELVSYLGKKLKKFDISTQEQADSMVSDLMASQFITKEISTKEKKSQTPPPFMTSTLQQSASSLLGYSPSRTMNIAQRLYEGVPTDSGIMGVITYMRTDSLNIAKEAQKAARAYIAKQYGDNYVPTKPKVYTSKSKGAQEAHEAIRPTNINFTPEIARNYLEPHELKLYTLIYNRFVASQAADAVFEVQDVWFESQKSEFKIHGRRLMFDGFLKILGNDDKDMLLPDFTLNAPIKPESITANKHTTEPPARYSEASLVKTLESLGIGRPSTYAPTISLIVSRGYLNIQNRQLVPHESAFVVTTLLEEHFCEIVDSAFSASMEEKLDSIALAEHSWQEVLWDFYQPFMEKIAQGKLNIASQKLAQPTGEFCPQCGLELIKRKSRYGEFVGCSGFPKCKYIKKDAKELESSGEACEKCGKPMVQKFSKTGAFLACSGYPECKNAKPLNAQAKNTKTLEVPCPECQGVLSQKMSKRGAFFGCNNYPKCTFLSPNEPTAHKCKACGYLLGKKSLKSGDLLECIRCKARYDFHTHEPLPSKATKTSATQSQAKATKKPSKTQASKTKSSRAKP